MSFDKENFNLIRIYFPPDGSRHLEADDISMSFESPDLTRCVGCLAFNLATGMGIDSACKLPAKMLAIKGSCGLENDVCLMTPLSMKRVARANQGPLTFPPAHPHI